MPNEQLLHFATVCVCVCVCVYHHSPRHPPLTFLLPPPLHRHLQSSVCVCARAHVCHTSRSNTSRQTSSYCILRLCVCVCVYHHSPRHPPLTLLLLLLLLLSLPPPPLHLPPQSPVCGSSPSLTSSWWERARGAEEETILTVTFWKTGAGPGRGLRNSEFLFSKQKKSLHREPRDKKPKKTLQREPRDRTNKVFVH